MDVTLTGYTSESLDTPAWPATHAPAPPRPRLRARIHISRSPAPRAPPHAPRTRAPPHAPRAHAKTFKVVWKMDRARIVRTESRPARAKYEPGNAGNAIRALRRHESARCTPTKTHRARACEERFPHARPHALSRAHASAPFPPARPHALSRAHASAPFPPARPDAYSPTPIPPGGTGVAKSPPCV